MDRSEIVQFVTLWFVAVVFLQTSSGPSGPLMTLIGFLALILLWGIPLYLFKELWSELSE